MLRHAPEIGVALFPEAVAAGDGMAEPGKDHRGILGHLPVGNLHGAGIQVVRMPSELGDARFHGVPGTSGLLEEHEEHRFVGKQRCGLVQSEAPLEIPGYVEKGFYFFVTPFLKRNEMFSSKLGLHNLFLSLIKYSALLPFLLLLLPSLFISDRQAPISLYGNFEAPPHRGRRTGKAPFSRFFRWEHGPDPRVPDRSRCRECRNAP